MKKIKLDCPINFLKSNKLEILLSNYGFRLNNNNPDCLVVNPGTDKFLGQDYFSNFDNLKVVGTPSTGVNHLDKKYLDSRNIRIFCLLDNRDALEDIHASAEFTWIHIMNAMRKFSTAIEKVSNWRDLENESYLRSNELASKKIGIIGLGRIGRKIAKYAEAFNMKITYYDPYVINENYDRVNDIRALNDCDIISINCYLTKETYGIIKYPILNNFKSNVIIVNTARGEVVDEEYIYDMIINERIIYCADVLKNEQEILKLKKSKLLNLKSDRLIITPHVAGATKESQSKALSGILSICQEYLNN